MKTNMSQADKIIRLIVAALIAVLYFMNVISGTLAIVLLIIATIFIVTSFINFCPLYALFGISTARKEKKTNY